MQLTDEQKVLADAALANKLNVIHHAYVDITGDLIAGSLLGQILYWFGKGKDGTSRAKIQAHGYTWIAKTRTDWHDEIRISPKQYDRAAKILKDKNFIEIKTMKFAGNPTTHIRIKPEAIAAALDAWKIEHVKSLLPDGEKPAAAGYPPMVNNELAASVITELPKGEEQTYSLANNEINQKDITSYTEITNKDNYKDLHIQAAGAGKVEAVAAHAATMGYINTTFEEAWAEYPRKEGKQAARVAYEKAVRGIGTRKPDGSVYTAEEILLQVKLYAAYMLYRIAAGEAEQRHIARGGNWFEREGWIDEYPTISSTFDEYADGVAYNRRVAQAWQLTRAIGAARSAGDTSTLSQLQESFTSLIAAL